MAALLDGEVRDRLLPGDAAAIASARLDALCWVLRHPSEKTLAKELKRITEGVDRMGLELRGDDLNRT